MSQLWYEKQKGDMSMHLKDTYEIMEIEGQSFAVPLEENEESAGCVIKLSETAEEIFSMLREDVSEEQIIKAMLQRYDVSEEILAADVHATIEKFRQKGLLA